MALKILHSVPNDPHEGIEGMHSQLAYHQDLKATGQLL